VPRAQNRFAPFAHATRHRNAILRTLRFCDAV
jgi:hypothetical protein